MEDDETVDETRALAIIADALRKTVFAFEQRASPQLQLPRRRVQYRSAAPLEQQHVELVRAIWRLFGIRPFRARAVIGRPSTAVALANAGIDSAKSLGWFLTQVAHRPMDGLYVVCVRQSRKGKRWQIRQVVS